MADEFTEHWLSTMRVPKFYFLNPNSDSIIIEDIAHALANTCRFGGHTTEFYSVAEHSILVSRVLESMGYCKRTVIAGLLHDAEEAYLPDIPSPIKALMPEAQRIYKGLNQAIIDKFGLTKANWKIVRDIDKRVTIKEAKHFGLWNNVWAYGGEPLDIAIGAFIPKMAEELFLLRYKRITKGFSALRI